MSTFDELALHDFPDRAIRMLFRDTRNLAEIDETDDLQRLEAAILQVLRIQSPSELEL